MWRITMGNVNKLKTNHGVTKDTNVNTDFQEYGVPLIDHEERKSV